MNPAGPRVVVSPHPDDAVWSLGGRLAKWVAAQEPVTVITVFDGAGRVDPAEPWRAVAEPRVRRAEDEDALACLGVRRISLGLADAALRTTGSQYRYTHPRRLFGAPSPQDADLAEVLAARLRPWCAAAAEVHAPLAAGHHVDHVLVREAVARLKPARTVWYEEFPYPLRARDVSGLRDQHEPLSPDDLERWLEGAGRYASQARSLCGDVPRLRAALTRRACEHASGTGLAHADRHWVSGSESEEEVPCLR